MTVRALVVAQLQTAWNRTRHESGLAGTAGTALTLAIAAGVLILPGGVMYGIGSEFGKALASPGSSEPFENWIALQAVFTLAFPLLGSYRFSPALSHVEFGRYPISHVSLAMAEVPAAIVEVFPLMGLLGLLMTNLGLAVQLPETAPLVAIAALISAVGIVSLMILVAGLMRLVGVWRSVALIVSSMLLLSGFSLKGFIVALKTYLPHVVALLPGTFAQRSVFVLGEGHAVEGLRVLAISIGGTAALVGAASLVHFIALRRGAFTTATSRREPSSGTYRGPEFDLAAYLVRQLAGDRMGRLLLGMPLVVVLALGSVRNLIALDVTRGKVPAEAMPPALGMLTQVPLFAVTIYAAVWLNSQVWMNQFGWDRGGIRSLMHLPISTRAMLTGKALGLLGFTSIQWVISSPVVLFFHRPSLLEVAGTIPAALIAFAVATMAGQIASIHAPRAVPRGGTATTPMQLSWIPGVLMIATTAVLAGIWGLGTFVGPWAAPVGLWLALPVVLLLWRMVLPQMEHFYLANREKLLAM